MSFYIPYSDLTHIWKSSSHLTLMLPWISIDLEIDEVEKEWILNALENLASDPFHPLTQKFLNNFKDYPVSYSAPRTSSEVVDLIDTYSVQDFSFLNLSSPSNLIKALNLDQSLELLEELPKDWEWSLTDILNSTRIEGINSHDPLSVVTYLIGKRLKTESATAKLTLKLPLNLDELRQRNESRFFDIMKILLRQTHHIAINIHDYTLPTRQSFPQAWEEISKFLEEERGHDQLMFNSLKELGCEDFKTIDPPETIILTMKLFQQAALYSPLAFTVIMGFLEGVTYDETDPLADVLKKSSKPRAAQGYEQHHKINLNSDHANFIFELTAFLKLISGQEVEYAARILELICHLGSINDKYFYSLTLGD